MNRFLSLTLCGLTAAVLLGCSRGTDKTGDGPRGNGGKGGVDRLNAGGASFIFPMMTKWTSEYKKAKGVEVNYTSTGSGAGIQQMIEKVYDLGCSDAPLNDDQLKKAKAKGGDVIHVPLAMGAVVP